jgi:hypothetical protein
MDSSRRAGMRFPSPPAAPLRLTAAVQNRMLVGGACKTQPPLPALRALLRLQFVLCRSGDGLAQALIPLRPSRVPFASWPRTQRFVFEHRLLLAVFSHRQLQSRSIWR